MRPALTALYVPGGRPELFARAAGRGADLLLLDLEDAVAPASKVQARADVVAWLAAGGAGRTPVQVRVNPLASPWGADDLSALPPGTPVRVPKVSGPDDVDAVLAGGGPRPVHALLESAVGVERAFEVASHPAVRTIGLGEADLRADLGLDGEAAMTWVRGRVVVAARAAGLPAPMMSVYPDITDLDGLAASCAQGRALGMRGRAAVHPSQVPVIAHAFRATATELGWARAVLAATADGGVAVLPSGEMVDEAMARRARDLVAAAAPVEDQAADR